MYLLIYIQLFAKIKHENRLKCKFSTQFIYNRSFRGEDKGHNDNLCTKKSWEHKWIKWWNNLWHSYYLYGSVCVKCRVRLLVRWRTLIWKLAAGFEVWFISLTASNLLWVLCCEGILLLLIMRIIVALHMHEYIDFVFPKGSPVFDNIYKDFLIAIIFINIFVFIFFYLLLLLMILIIEDCVRKKY